MWYVLSVHHTKHSISMQHVQSENSAQLLACATNERKKRGVLPNDLDDYVGSDLWFVDGCQDWRAFSPPPP